MLFLIDAAIFTQSDKLASKSRHKASEHCTFYKKSAHITYVQKWHLDKRNWRPHKPCTKQSSLYGWVEKEYWTLGLISGNIWNRINTRKQMTEHIKNFFARLRCTAGKHFAVTITFYVYESIAVFHIRNQICAYQLVKFLSNVINWNCKRSKLCEKFKFEGIFRVAEPDCRHLTHFLYSACQLQVFCHLKAYFIAIR